MKVVCIILLFVIAAEGADTNQDMTARSPSRNRGTGNVKLNFPKFIKDPLKLADELLTLCDKEKKTYSTNDHVAINEKQVNFKNCTFICKYEKANVTRSLPKSTPCGPGNQTCAKPDECVGGLPGC
uniref:Putative ixodes 8-cys protein n=1 Tax=Ixodes ricinus TaxID=34613 RepID=A0A0K8RD53_IXORI